jgi:hypothetical protein
MLMRRRRRSKEASPLNERIKAFTREMENRAERLPHGPERDALIKKARQAVTAVHLEDWAHSPKSQRPE